VYGFTAVKKFYSKVQLNFVRELFYDKRKKIIFSTKVIIVAALCANFGNSSEIKLQ
jgi:hypothetical protein